MKFKVLKVH